MERERERERGGERAGSHTSTFLGGRYPCIMLHPTVSERFEVCLLYVWCYTTLGRRHPDIFLSCVTSITRC